MPTGRSLTSPAARAVLATLRAAEGPLTANQIAEQTHYQPNTVRWTLTDLAAADRVAYGEAGPGEARPWRLT